MRSIRRHLMWGISVVSLVAAGCGGDEPPRVKPGTGYSAVIAWAVAREFPDRGPDDKTPLVFITTSDGSTISASTQAKVTRDAGDDIAVNFVDKREDAIDGDDPVEAVKDDGLLVTLGPIADDARSSVEVSVMLYTNYVENTTWKLLLVARSGEDEVQVTQEEEQKPAPP